MRETMKERTPGRGLPDWLDARTVAVLTVMVTIGLTLATMMQTAHARLDARIESVRGELSADIESVRGELSADIERVRGELSADIEKLQTELGADIEELDDRVRSLEIDVSAIRTVVVGLDAGSRDGDDAPM